MLNKKQKFLKFLKYFVIFSLVFIIISIISFEFLSRYYQCPKIAFPKHPDCYTFTLLENGDWEGGYTFDSFFNEEDRNWLESLRQKRKEGLKISKEEYRQASDYFMIEVSKEEMPGLNGISCGDFGYVREDLPVSAKLFVKRHEFEHMMQEGNMEEGNQEFQANLAAFSEYPFGGLQTVFFSIFGDRTGSSFSVCRFVRLWQLFKVYFLPFETQSIYN
ncbi:hypothetical protein A2X44_04305 [candidate division CPR3 bacterium GWF2_35_18]|uniref:Uncharacterized protein n=1 Tax=candidate division CPR3 bacterium GW2011_GWF2_35_18 TaxID=1618350 RepID=A0A0G0BZQ4_UNCC3|nr:MAG: hypothetical protein UR67_C0007G0051 [candidate division CPR3 bacterium GW2011_GWF2_35_18]KKP86949.1 MAG: hypothetical protein UR87_C0007G0011 [candidate division CPR3 bacterium GW2011_GWE2_35_7]OGB62577.1 MAG: hypothetical protein A2X44_04305 [candidate division CPR3 bacterium GWF2_35_18]OGB65828.1 MAG: hypothetical protein A2250_01555 [candidate division CPR3 bacterium RIFOXYA2_FULL_35_13]OGB77244.1 MAG: hypothetical protein A2476_01645 [candidate division CPR3 bacterium RIFOXYC2_FULL